MARKSFAACSLVSLLVLGGCAETDTDAPAAPFVDPVVSPTAEPSQAVTGTAEYGATVRISGGAQDVETTADRYTARFRAEVPLTPNAVNTLSVTATDAKGNTSEATTVVINTIDSAVKIENLRVDGQDCATSGTPPACVVRAGQLVEFVVTATDDRSLTEIAYTAFFATAGASGSLRERTVLIPQNAALPLSQPFSFVVPDAILEDVALTALAVDGEGNRSTSRQVLLRVTLTTFGGRIPSLVVRDLPGARINAPEDVAFNAAGDLFIANSGNNNLLRVAAGAFSATEHVSAPTFSSNVAGGFSPSFLLVDPSGALFTTDRGGDNRIARISAATPPATTEYVQYTFGVNTRGLAYVGAVRPKALIELRQLVDGEVVTIGGLDYEIDLNSFCPTTSRCFSGSTLGALATALANCINSGSGCTLGAPAGSAAAAHPDVSATAATGAPVDAVVLAALVDGPSTVGLDTSSCLAISFNGNRCPPAVTGLTHGEGSLFVAMEGGADAVLRFATDLTGARDETDAVGNAAGAWDMSFGGIREQWGLAVRYTGTNTSRDWGEFTFYFPDETAASNRLRGVRHNGLIAQPVFNSAAVAGGRPPCGDCIRGTNDPTVPPTVFSRLWDVVQLSDGCLVVSDEGRGAIYTVDARSSTAADPLVSLVATGLASPRGMAVNGAGELVVALVDINAVVKFTPSPDGADCF